MSCSERCGSVMFFSVAFDKRTDQIIKFFKKSSFSVVT